MKVEKLRRAFQPKLNHVQTVARLQTRQAPPVTAGGMSMYASEYKNTRGMTPQVSNAKIFVNRNPLQTVTQHVTDYYDLSMNGKPATTFYETTRKQASTLSTMRDIELETTENLKDAVKSKSHLF